MSSSTGSAGLEDALSDPGALVSALATTSLDVVSQNDSENPLQPSRPLRIYTRAQLLNLQSSPLVQPPPDMPELRSWFGRTENEQNLAKKDPEPLTQSGSRDRRFRRDFEDGEPPSRQSFRSALTQPSQMGNFKHQSLRDRDRDKDRDGDKDRERDIRDREGQERLRHLSDKYDRDRLSLSSSNARAKDRDGANSSTRTSSQAQTTSNSSRRGEPRDPSKRKFPESGDDWRRGDIPRNGREDRSDTSRRDRERSRPRDSSRSLPEPSGRRDRGSDREEAKERPTRDNDDDDESRHWRDDGKRDDRVATRKARERVGDHWEPSTDRRWAATEERDGRYKRTNGRDRRNGEEVRDRDDRKDRDREREKEKEPAWMEAYVPAEPLPGILGAVSSTGELDGIQAWKKGLKEKDDKDNGNRQGASDEYSPTADTKGVGPSKGDNGSAHPLDEIQMFRLMMQKEKDKRDDRDAGDLPAASLSVTNKSAVVDYKGTVQSSETARITTTTNISQDSASLESRAGRVKESSPTSSQDILDPRQATFETNPTHTVLHSEKTAPETLSQFNPPSGPRLLALGRGANKPPVQSPVPLNPHTTNSEASRGAAGFSPFDDAAKQSRAFLDRGSVNNLSPPEALQRVQADRSPLNQHQPFTASPLDSAIDVNPNGYAASKGSRFAKFFDGKTRDAPPPAAKAQTPIGITSPSPNHGQRFDQGSYNGTANNTEEPRTMEDIIAMLANSQAHRGQNVNIGGGLPSLQHNPSFNGHGNHQMMHQHHQLNANRSESLYDSRLDDRSFVPDGMVPGLRTAPPPRSRDNFSDPMDDILHIQRLAHQQQLQHRADPNFGGPVNSMFAQQARGIGVPLQQQPYRGGPSPNTAQQLGLAPSQRLPPGLANLGSRPPHESSQFLGGPSGPQLAALANNGQLPQQFNNFNNSNLGNLLYGNHQQFRGPPPSMNLQNAGGHLSLSNLAQNIDPRLAAGQSFGHGLGGGVSVGHRGPGNNGLMPQQRPGPQLVPHLGLRPQQQPQLPPHMLPHMHHPSGQGQQGPTNQPAQDLMALLMGGTLRE